jgi:CRP-like cAMP-binding protein
MFYGCYVESERNAVGEELATDGQGVDAFEASIRELMPSYGRGFAQGDVLFREGDVAEEAYVLHRGRVRLVKRVRTAERSLAVLAAGDLFGESALTGTSVRTSTAIALTEGTLLVLDGASLGHVLEQFPHVSRRILLQLVGRVRDAEDQIEVLVHGDAPSKVVGALLKMARGVEGTAHFKVSPIELAARVALDVETVKRAVLRLRSQHFVKIADEMIEIPDLSALRQFYALLGSKEALRGDGISGSLSRVASERLDSP